MKLSWISRCFSCPAFLLLALGFSATARCQTSPATGAAPDKPAMQTYVEEFFLSDAVRNEDKGELQFTFSTDSRQGLGSNVALQVEYGVTRRLQFNLDLPYGFSASENSEVAAAWSTTGLGLQYQIIRSDSPFALSVGTAFGIPMKANANWSLEPTVLAAKTFKKFQVHASLVAEVEQWKPSFQYNVASVCPVRRRWFPTLEFNGRRLEGKNAFYLTPGLYRHFDHRLEIGIGVPAGLGGVASHVGLVGKINWELGGDSEDRPGR